jgi:hypothetical protein
LYKHIRNKESTLCKLKKKNTRERSWRSSVMWTVIHSWRVFHLLSVLRLPDFWHQYWGAVVRGESEGGGVLMKKCWLSVSP